MPFLTKSAGKVVAGVCFACVLVVIMLYVNTQMEMVQSREFKMVQIRPTTPAYARVGSRGNTSLPKITTEGIPLLKVTPTPAESQQHILKAVQQQIQQQVQEQVQQQVQQQMQEQIKQQVQQQVQQQIKTGISEKAPTQQQSPVQQAPVQQQAPAQQVPAQQAPAQQAPAQQAPAQQSPAQQAPAQQAPAQQAPGQQAPAQQAPAQQAPTKLPRILCWVMVDPSQMQRATDVKETWASHCDMCLFMSSEQNDSFPTIGLDVPAGRDHIGAKSKAAWTYIYKHHINDADYFVKTDPDTFLVVENLKEYMARRNPDDPEFFGHRMYISAEGKTIIYNSGGPGQLLSRKAVEILVTKAFADKTSDCMKDGQGEDWKTGWCLTKHGARSVDTRDSQGRMTFMIFQVYAHMKNSDPQWYTDRIVDDVAKSYKCCSEYPIGFHYVSGLEMHKLYYYMYEMKHAGAVVTNLSDKEKFQFVKPDGHEKKTWYPT